MGKRERQSYRGASKKSDKAIDEIDARFSKVINEVQSKQESSASRRELDEDEEEKKHESTVQRMAESLISKRQRRTDLSQMMARSQEMSASASIDSSRRIFK